MALGFHSHRIRPGARLQAGTLGLALALLGALVLGGCGEPTGEPRSCGKSEPAFSIHVSAPEPRLPSDLAVTAVYGAGSETYRLGTPEPRGEVLFCSVSAPAHGSPQADPWESLDCELWTDSSVTLRVTSASYASLEEELKPTLDRCGAVTSEVELMLVAPLIDADP